MVCHVDLIPIAAFFNLVNLDHHTQLHRVFFIDFTIGLYGLADISQSQIQFKMYEDVIIHQNLFSL